MKTLTKLVSFPIVTLYLLLVGVFTLVLIPLPLASATDPAVIVSSLKDYSYVTEDTKIQLEIQRIGVIPGGVQVEVRAFDDTFSQFGFGSDGSVEFERINIINPPVFVPSGVSYIEDFDGTPIVKDEFVYDPAKALHIVLAQTIQLIGKKDTVIEFGKVGNTTTVVYPEPHTATTAGDGVLVKLNANWDTAHDSATADTAYNNPTENVVGYDTQIELWRGIFNFDTSSIPDTDTVSSATLSLYVSGKDDANGHDSIGIVDVSPASNTVVATGDFDAFATTDFATRKDIGTDITTSQYNDWSLNVSGIANILLTGVSNFGVRTGKDIDDVNPTPSGENRIIVRMADYTNTTSDPKLTIEHSAGGGGGGSDYSIASSTATSTDPIVETQLLFLSTLIFMLSGFFVTMYIWNTLKH